MALISFPCLGIAANEESDRFKESVRRYSQGKYSESSQILQELVKKHPQKAIYWFNLGNAAFMTKSYPKAVQHYDKVIAIGGNLTPAAKLYKAKALKALGKIDQASAILQQLSTETLPPALASQVQSDLATLTVQTDLEEKALAAYQAGNHAEAERLLTQKPEHKLSESGRLLLGLTYIRQSKDEQAESILNRVLTLPTLSSEDRSVAQDLLKKVRRRELENSPYWAYADLSHGTIDNVYMDGKSIPAVKSSFTKAAFGTGYHFNQGQKWSKKLGYSLYYEFPHQAPELKTLTHTLQAPLVLKEEEVDASLAPYVQQQTWNEVSVSRKYGLSSRNSFTRNNYELGLDIDIASQSSLDSNFSYLSGTGNSVRTYVGFWDSLLYGQIYFVAGNDGTQDLVFADGSVLPMKHAYQSLGARVVWKPALLWSVALDVAQTQRKYSSPTLPSGTSRTDNEFSWGLKTAYRLTPVLGAYAQAESAKNSSTLNTTEIRDKNYEAFAMTVGLSWEMF